MRSPPRGISIAGRGEGAARGEGAESRRGGPRLARILTTGRTPLSTGARVTRVTGSLWMTRDTALCWGGAVTCDAVHTRRGEPRTRRVGTPASEERDVQPAEKMEHRAGVLLNPPLEVGVDVPPPRFEAHEEVPPGVGGAGAAALGMGGQEVHPAAHVGLQRRARPEAQLQVAVQAQQRARTHEVHVRRRIQLDETRERQRELASRERHVAVEVVSRVHADVRALRRRGTGHREQDGERQESLAHLILRTRVSGAYPVAGAEVRRAGTVSRSETVQCESWVSILA